MINIWDLEKEYINGKPAVIDTLATIPQSLPHYEIPKARHKGHEFAITGVRWWPIDTGMFTSSSFDKFVKIWDTNTLEVSPHLCRCDDRMLQVFHSTQKSIRILLRRYLAIHLSLVSALRKLKIDSGGAEHPSIRLLDLRTGGITHTLIGHEWGFVIPVRWSPTNPYLLVSGGSDGTVHLWDVRRGKACLASLDQHNTASREKGGWLNRTNGAHDGVVNGLEFTADGLHLVSLGHDDKMRVWDLESGLNTLVRFTPFFMGIDRKVSFGPSIRNQHRMEVTPYITSPDTCLSPLVFVPSDDAEILCFELYTGQLIQRLQGVTQNINGRVTCVVGRTSHQVEFLLEYYNIRNYIQELLMQKLACGNQV